MPQILIGGTIVLLMLSSYWHFALDPLTVEATPTVTVMDPIVTPLASASPTAVLSPVHTPSPTEAERNPSVFVPDIQLKLMWPPTLEQDQSLLQTLDQHKGFSVEVESLNNQYPDLAGSIYFHPDNQLQALRVSEALKDIAVFKLQARESFSKDAMTVWMPN